MPKRQISTRTQSLKVAVHIVFVYFFDKSSKNGYEVAKAMGITRSSFSRILHFERSISFAEMVCFCEFLNIPFATIVAKTTEVEGNEQLHALFRKTQDAKEDERRLFEQVSQIS